jgi:hypothetical protein
MVTSALHVMGLGDEPQFQNAVLEFLACAAGLPQPVTVITRLRLDAALY